MNKYKLIPNRAILLRQEDIGDGKKKDVHTVKGKPIEVTDREAIEFWGAFENKMPEDVKKKLLIRSKNQNDRVFRRI